MKISIQIEVPETVEFESIREYFSQTLIEFVTDTSKEFDLQPSEIVTDFTIE